MDVNKNSHFLKTEVELLFLLSNNILGVGVPINLNVSFCHALHLNFEGNLLSQM